MAAAAAALPRCITSKLRTTFHAHQRTHDLSTSRAATATAGGGNLPPASAGGIANAASRIILNRQEWEQTILSDVPVLDLSNPEMVRLVLLSNVPALDLSNPEMVRLVLLNLRNPHLSYRFFQWMSSHKSYSTSPVWLSPLCVSLVKEKRWEAARHVLCSMKCQRHLNALKFYLKSLCREGMVAEAMATVLEFRKNGVHLDVGVWNKLLAGALQGKRTDLVWKVYEKMMELGVGSDGVTASHLIRALCKDNKLHEAYVLVRELVDGGSVPSVSAFTALISGFSNNGDNGKVTELLHMMIAKDCYPDVYTYQVIIHGLCKNDMVLEGLRMFKEIKERGYVLDVVIYTTMIHGLWKMKRMDAAVNLWREMHLERITPNAYAYNVMIDGYCKAGKLEVAEKLYEKMCSKGHGESTVSCNTLITGYCSQGRMKEARFCFEKMKSNGIKCDTITYNALVEGFCKEGNVSEALNLLLELLQTGLQPNSLSYIFLIEYLCQAGDVEKAIELQNEMFKRGLEPSRCSYDYIICAFCKLGNLCNAMDWLSHTIGRRIKPKKETFELLIVSLTMKYRVDDALLVLDCMHKLGYVLQESVSGLLVRRLCEGNLDREGKSLDAILGT